ncbi:Uncharacterised protein [Klebsiella pneumoniae]|uniref:Uncharacterized protein n=1 Tax=Klebsiella pneumoniae TaxID=573 RepID=A0A378C9L6_KLEPN|nr:Uncharacterised protein [Klebsiella pneumoniae]
MHADKGFTIRDGGGHLYGTDLTVEAVSDTVVHPDSLAGPGAAQSRFGWVIKPITSGTHNIADSEDTAAPYTWELVTGYPLTSQLPNLTENRTPCATGVARILLLQLKRFNYGCWDYCQGC